MLNENKELVIAGKVVFQKFCKFEKRSIFLPIELMRTNAIIQYVPLATKIIFSCTGK